jgi:hypothetical protein
MAHDAPDQLRYLSEHGRWRNNPDPFVILHGPRAYMVQALGVTERAAIIKEYEAMLRRLCGLRKVWCLPSSWFSRHVYP